MTGGCFGYPNGKRPFCVLGTSVACLSFEDRTSGVVTRAYAGMLVCKHPSFPEGEEAGRVGNGIGVILNPDAGLGNVVVYWENDGDTTLWTRAACHGFDLVSATRNLQP